MKRVGTMSGVLAAALLLGTAALALGKDKTWLSIRRSGPQR